MPTDQERKQLEELFGRWSDDEEGEIPDGPGPTPVTPPQTSDPPPPPAATTDRDQDPAGRRRDRQADTDAPRCHHDHRPPEPYRRHAPPPLRQPPPRQSRLADRALGPSHHHHHQRQPGPGRPRSEELPGLRTPSEHVSRGQSGSESPRERSWRFVPRRAPLAAVSAVDPGWTMDPPI
ncbi:WAS/WASL-interacting protein family member 1-like [Polyergus mexicanus]|uniref:WAS/WASL-interacting protein family member 1-like n=1 Tax=Polyergus mexicanus TaxID=615972 RepID=UPI0038B5943D